MNINTTNILKNEIPENNADDEIKSQVSTNEIKEIEKPKEVKKRGRKPIEKEVFISNDTINDILNYKPLETFRCLEVIYNQEVLEVLADLNPLLPNYNKIPDALYAQNIDFLKVIKQFTKKTGHIVDYNKGCCNRGRYTPKNTNKKDYASLQGCYNIVRRLICNNQLKGIDIKNCHIEIIKNLCSILNIDVNVEILDKYCQNREQILNEIKIVFNCDRKTAKEFFIIILFGGSFNTWINSCNLLGKEKFKTSFQQDFIDTINKITYEIQKIDIFNGFIKIAKDIQNKQAKYSANITALAIFLQEIESKILLVMKNKLEEFGCIIRIPIHDAVWYEDPNNITNDDLIKILQDQIKKELNLIIPLDFDDTQITDDDKRWFENHKQFYKDTAEIKDYCVIENGNDDIGASNHIIAKFYDRLIVCEDKLYVNTNNIWVSNENDVEKVLHNFIANTDIRYETKNDAIHYNKSKKNISNCIKCIIKSDKISVDNDFHNNIIKNTKYYLPFNDGIYSFLDKKLYRYEELPNIKFIQKINHDFPVFNQNDFDELMNKVLIPIYPDEIERNFNGHIRSRAYAGCIEDKMWYGLIGSRNCGKGIETKLNQLAFEKFFGEFSTSHLLQKEGDYDDKHLAWVIPIRNCRVIIANEVDKKKNKKNINVNTKLIKSLASGGDRIDGRLLHENSFSFTPNFTIFICSNDGLKVDEDCQDVFENYEEFSYKSKFVKEEDLVEGCSFLKLKDENIKSLIEEPRIYNAYLHYILNSFNNPRLKTPDSVKISTKISKGETIMKIEDFIIKNFKTTHEKNDRLHTLKIQEICNENGYKIELIDCGRIMSRIGIGRYNEKCSVDKIRKSGYEYIKYIGT